MMHRPHSLQKNNKRLPPRDQLVMGIHAVQELLRYTPERLLRVYFDQAKKEERKTDLLQLCKKKNIPVILVSSAELEQMTGSPSHQSAVAHIQGRAFLDIKNFLLSVENKEKSLVLMIDTISDPQNFGGLIRSAECLGADAIVWSKNRGVDMTPTVTKASSGASEFLPLMRVANLAESLSQFQEAGFEAVVSVINPVSQNGFAFSFFPKTVLVVGSEEDGIQPLLQKRANRAIYIPMQGKIASLNVTTAAGILMALYKRQFYTETVFN